MTKTPPSSEEETPRTIDWNRLREEQPADEGAPESASEPPRRVDWAALREEGAEAWPAEPSAEAKTIEWAKLKASDEQG